MLLCFYKMVMEGLSNGIVFMNKYQEKKGRTLMAREWIKSIQVSVNIEHKRTKRIVAREEARAWSCPIARKTGEAGSGSGY